MASERDFTSPEYVKWRTAVLERDRNRCRLPECTGEDKRMEVHHIKKWDDFPHLRFTVSNGITLCKTCHIAIGKKEEEYEKLFTDMVKKSTDITLQLILRRHGKH